MIELLVVISIIAILSVIGLIAFGGVQKLGRDTKRRADLKAIATALEIYKVTNSSYAGPLDTWLDSGSANNPWLTGLNSNYMINLPRDPINTGNRHNSSSPGFLYDYAQSGDTFILVARLESPNSDDKKTKCTYNNNLTRDNDTYGSSDSGARSIYPNTYWVCSQQ